MKAAKCPAAFIGRILTLPRQTAEIKKEVRGQRSAKIAKISTTPPLFPPPIYSNGEAASI
jgi:hypothetical protein